MTSVQGVGRSTGGKPVNLTQLQAEIETAGVMVSPGLGTIEDYVHTRFWEVTLQLLNLFACTLGAIASLFAIVRIALMA